MNVARGINLHCLCVCFFVCFFLCFFFFAFPFAFENGHRFKNFFVLIQFNVPFKIISLIELSQSIGGAKREYPGKTT